MLVYLYLQLKNELTISSQWHSSILNIPAIKSFLWNVLSYKCRNKRNSQILAWFVPFVIKVMSLELCISNLHKATRLYLINLLSKMLTYGIILLEKIYVFSEWKENLKSGKTIHFWWAAFSEVSPHCSMPEFRNGKNLWQWSQLEKSLASIVFLKILICSRI